LQLKKLICTCYKHQNFSIFQNSDEITDKAVAYEYDGINEKIIKLDGDGDFRSDECLKYLKKCDVVVTNPPFSLFREYVDKLIESEKKFLIIGNKNSASTSNIFKLIQSNKL
jgi:hypothetical protein